MSRIEKFGDFTSEGFDSFMARQRRIVTGASAGEEIHKLSEEQQQELMDLYIKDPNEAAKYLRSIIIREKNKQFGLGLALTVAGAAMIYKAMNVNPPPPPPKVDGQWVDVNGGEGQTQFLKRVFNVDVGPNATRQDFIDAVANKLGNGNYNVGAENFCKGIPDPSVRAEVLENLLSVAKGDSGDLLKNVFSGDLAPHGGLAWGDAGVKVWVPNTTVALP